MDYKVIYKKYVGYEFNDFPISKHKTKIDELMYYVHEYVYDDIMSKNNKKILKRYEKLKEILFSIPKNLASSIYVMAESMIQEIRHTSCNTCNKLDLFGNKRCSICHNAWYCSIECQKKDYQSHKNICIKGIRDTIHDHIKKKWYKLYNLLIDGGFKLFKTKFNDIEFYVIIALYIDKDNDNRVICIEIANKSIKNLIGEYQGNNIYMYFTNKNTVCVSCDEKYSHLYTMGNGICVGINENNDTIYTVDYETGLIID